jgi:hypothetical protein
MKQTTKSIATAVFVISAVLLLSGCWPFPSQKQVGEKIMEKAIESQTGGKVDVNAEKNSMTINGEEGSTTVSGEGQAKLPDNFPSDIFVYSDAKIIVASAMKEGDSFSVTYATETSVDDAFSKYKDELTGNGWTKENEVDLGTQGKMLNFKKENRSVLVTIGIDNDGQNKGKTMVSVVVSTDKSASSSPAPTEGGGENPAPQPE